MGANEERPEGADLDAMGLDKRREVVGGRYRPSPARQAATYGLFLAVLAVLVVGAIIAVNEFDQPSDDYPAAAPWAEESAPQIEPAPLDYPRNGETGPGS